MAEPRIFTCSYKGFHPAMGVPVRTSVGRPRHALKYDLSAEASLLYPSYAMLKMEYEEYRERYIAQLERHGVQKIQNVLRSIQTIYGKGTNHVVLLCYEDVIKKGDWCHRRMFAQWWEEKNALMDVKVPEIHLDLDTGELEMLLVTRGDKPRPPDQESLL